MHDGERRPGEDRRRVTLGDFPKDWLPLRENGPDSVANS